LAHRVVRCGAQNQNGIGGDSGHNRRRSGALATAGVVVFTVLLDGTRMPLDDQSLDELWSINAGTVIRQISGRGQGRIGPDRCGLTLPARDPVESSGSSYRDAGAAAFSDTTWLTHSCMTS
jgi:hypothetical protein